MAKNTEIEPRAQSEASDRVNCEVNFEDGVMRIIYPDDSIREIPVDGCRSRVGITGVNPYQRWG